MEFNWLIFFLSAGITFICGVLCVWFFFSVILGKLIKKIVKQIMD